MTEHTPDNAERNTPDPSRRPSKTERKRRSADLQELGQELIHLERDHLARMALPAELLDAVNLARSMKQDGAYQRQKKYIGKLLRLGDAESIRARLAEIGCSNIAATRSLHRIEGWRDRLLADGDAALAELLKDFPQAERPKLRQLVAAARVEKERNQAPKSARMIFKYLRALMERD